VYVVVAQILTDQQTAVYVPTLSYSCDVSPADDTCAVLSKFFYVFVFRFPIFWHRNRFKGRAFLTCCLKKELSTKCCIIEYVGQVSPRSLENCGPSLIPCLKNELSTKCCIKEYVGQVSPRSLENCGLWSLLDILSKKELSTKSEVYIKEYVGQVSPRSLENCGPFLISCLKKNSRQNLRFTSRNT